MLSIYKKYDFFDIFPYLIFFFIALIRFYRIRYGVELTDEVFPIAMSHYFAQGAQPFVDEISATQGIAILLTPITAIFIFLFKSEGIIIFYRCLYLLLKFFLFFVSYKTFKQFLTRPFALGIASFLLADNYYMINFSYNSVFSSFFYLGNIFLLRAYFLQQPNNKEFSINPLFISAGFCHAIVCVVYPTFSFVILFLFPFYLILFKRKKEIFINYLFPFILVGLYPLVVLLQAGILTSITRTYTYVNAFNMSSKNAIIIFFQNFLHINFYNFIVAVIFYIFLFTKKLHKFESLAYFIFLIILTWRIYYLNFVNPDYSTFAIYFGLLNIFLLPVIFKHEILTRIFLLLWIPSFCGILCAITSSSSGVLSAIISSNGTFIATLLSFCILITQSYLSNHNWLNYSFILFLVFIYFGIFYTFNNNYRDDNTLKLNTKITKGPYKGIWTTSIKAQFLEDLEKSFNEFVSSTDTIVFYDRFPAGYLLSHSKALTPTIWLFQQKDFSPFLDRKIILQYYTKKKQIPTVVFKMKKVFYSSEEGYNELVYLKTDDFDKFVLSNYYPVFINENFEIYRSRKELRQDPSIVAHPMQRIGNENPISTQNDSN